MALVEVVFGITSTLTIGVCLLPFLQCLEWRRRGTSDGFSAVMLVFSCIRCLEKYSFVYWKAYYSTALWFSYMYLLNDNFGIMLNATIVSLFAFYTLVYWYYHPKRVYLYAQLAVGLVALAVIMLILATMDTFEDKKAFLGNVASTGQMFSMSGALYEIYRVIFLLKTTEYIPAEMVFGGAVIGSMWMWTGYLLGDPYMIRANAFGMAVNIVQQFLFFVYPPKTWVVPFYGVGGHEKLLAKNE